MDIEEHIATMAPREADVLVLYEAIKQLQLHFGLAVDAKVSPKSDVQLLTVLRRSFQHKQRGITTYYNLAAEKNCYRNSIQVGADRFSILYHNFVSAAYGFCDLVPSFRYRRQTIEGE